MRRRSLAAANVCWNLGYDRATLSTLAARVGERCARSFSPAARRSAGGGESGSNRSPVPADAAFRRGASAGRPVDGRRVPGVPARPAAASRSRRFARRWPRRLAGGGPAVVQSVGRPAATLSPYVRQLRARVRSPGLPGPCDERQRNVVFWYMPPRPPCPAGGPAFASEKLGERLAVRSCR